jgi:cellobiose phosphorylase
MEQKYGHFDDAKREYVITEQATPAPWINCLGTQGFFSLISHRGGGYSFYRDARLRRLTRFRYNSLPGDDAGRRLFIHDAAGTWSAPGGPDLEEFEARHGLGYSQFTTAKGGVRVQQLFFVPPDVPGEIEHVTITNTSDSAKDLRVFSYREFCLWDAWDDQTNFQRNYSTGEVEVDGSAIYHVTEYRERRNHYAVFWVNQPIAGFDTDRETFVGQWHDLDHAQVPAKGAPSNSRASGWSPIGAHALEIHLEPGEAKDLTFVLAYVENPDDNKWDAPGVVRKAPARELFERFDTSDKVMAAWQQLKDYWEGALANFQVRCADKDTERMAGVWNQYQCMVTFNLSRSASYFESGVGRGMGFRDSNQDLFGMVHIEPARARERLLALAATQFADGGAYHQFQPLTGQGNNDIGSGFNDDPLWLVFGAVAYVKETGDFDVLSAQVPFADQEAADSTPTLMDHLVASYKHVVEHLGPHALPLIGRADWNDCLNLNCFSTTPGEPFQTTTNKEDGTAESIFIAGMFTAIIPELATIARRANRLRLAQQMDTAVEQMHQAAQEHGWDGDWFLRAYDAAGEPVGSHTNAEGQIYIEPQGMCVMGGMGLEDGRARQALDAVAERLAGPNGIALLAPAYTTYHVELGEISTYPPGYKENGGVFSHNNPWIIVAETLVGRPERAYDYYRRINPSCREAIASTHRLEPYVYAQMIAGPQAPRHGEAKNSWLTGAASWAFRAVSQHLLGIRPEFDGLVVSPCLPPEFGPFEVTRRFRGATYQIKVNHLGSDGHLFVDGEEVPGNVIPPAPKGATVEVRYEA